MGGSTFSLVWMILVLVLILLCLLSDKVYPDHIMLFSLVLLLAGSVITLEEGLAGFSNPGLLTVLALFVVASGISHTGGLDWYMSKLLGTPSFLASTQLRLMIPIAIVSAFLNNTPVVAVMIPIIQRWAVTISRPVAQLLIPLSYASILGGTCTLIGTSTNLVVAGLLAARYPDTPGATIGIFDLSLYGVPVLLMGLSYIVLAAPYLLPSSSSTSSSSSGTSGSDAIPSHANSSNSTAVANSANHQQQQQQQQQQPSSPQSSQAPPPSSPPSSFPPLTLPFSCVVMPYSHIVGSSIEAVGLRNIPGLFLMDVVSKNASDTDSSKDNNSSNDNNSSGYKIVSPDYILSGNDVLVFEGTLTDSFIQTCQDHGLHLITSDYNGDYNGGGGDGEAGEGGGYLDTVHEIDEHNDEHNDECCEASNASNLTNIGTTKNNFMNSTIDERIKYIVKLRLIIKHDGVIPDDVTLDGRFYGVDGVNGASGANDYGSTKQQQQRNPSNLPKSLTPSISIPRPPVLAEQLNTLAPPSVIVAPDTSSSKKNIVLVGINAPDRTGLMHDISKGLARLSCNATHTEASVVGLRSISIWRCEVGGGLRAERRKKYGVDDGDVEEIFVVMQDLLSEDTGYGAIKKRGLRVIRTRVRPGSSLVGKTPVQSRFRLVYRAAIIAVQRNGIALSTNLQRIKFEVGDLLLLQVGDDSVLLTREFNERQKDVKADGTLSSKEPDGATTPTRRSRLSGAFGSILKGSGSRDGSRSGSRSGSSDNLKAMGEREEQEEEDARKAIELTQVSVALGGGVNNRGSGVLVEDLIESQDSSKQIDKLVVDISVETPLQFDANLFDNVAEFQGKEFLTAMTIKKRSKLAGKTLAESGIRKLPGIHLFSIERPVEEEEVAAAVATGQEADTAEEIAVASPGAATAAAAAAQPANNVITISNDAKLKEGDIVWFCGSGESIMELRKIPGLSQMENSEVKKLGANNQRRLVQGVVARKGPLVGKSIRELKFRTRFQCVVIAVHREGTRVTKQIGGIVLHAGDVLLMEASPSFLKENGDNSRCFALLSEIKDSAPPRLKLLIPALLLAAAMLAVYTAGLAELFTTAILASAGMIMIGILTQQEARDAVNWEIFVTIGSAFGIGTAMVNSGVAGGVANGLTSIADGLGMGDAGLYAMVYLATVLISNIVTNNAAAALVFPIAMDAAEKQGISVVKMSYCLMLSASASFSSPFGYQTNLMVYGPGGYKFIDFVKMGGPMQIVLWIWTVVLLSVEGVSSFVWWGVGAVALVASVGGRWQWEKRRQLRRP
jgi:di/tricarboxylate transporter